MKDAEDRAKAGTRLWSQDKEITRNSAVSLVVRATTEEPQPPEACRVTQLQASACSSRRREASAIRFLVGQSRYRSTGIHAQ